MFSMLLFMDWLFFNFVPFLFSFKLIIFLFLLVFILFVFSSMIILSVFGDFSKSGNWEILGDFGENVTPMFTQLNMRGETR